MAWRSRFSRGRAKFALDSGRTSTLDGWRPETTSGPWSGRLARVRACTGVFASAAAAWRALCTKSIFGHSESLIANLALSEARRELQFFLQLVLYGSVTPQTVVWRRRWIRLCIHLESRRRHRTKQIPMRSEGPRRSDKLGSQPSRWRFRVCHRARGPAEQNPSRPHQLGFFGLH